MKKIFGRKKDTEMSEEQIKNTLSDGCIPTAAPSSRTSKFSAYSEYAQQLSAKSGSRAPAPGSNPYAQMNVPGSYGGPNVPAPGSAPVGYPPQGQPASSYGYNEPHRQQSPAPSYQSYDPNPQNASNPYAQAASQYENRFEKKNPMRDTDSVLDARRNELFSGAKPNAPDPSQQPHQQQQASGSNMSGPNRAALFGAAINKPSDPNQFTQSNYSTAFDNAPVARNQDPGRSRFQQKKPEEYTNDEELLYMETASVMTKDTNAGPTAVDFDQEQNSEDEDVETIKQQMKFIKRDDVNLTRSALRSAAFAEESGRNALGMLGAQGERLRNADASVDLAATQNRIANEQTRELKTLTRSMFAVHVSNPFNSKKRNQEKEEAIKAERLRQQVARESIRQEGFESQQRVMRGLGALPGTSNTGNSATAQKYKKNYKERSKYQFEADSEDEMLEDEIDNNLNALHDAAKRLNGLAQVTNQEITRQNEQLAKMSENVDTLDIGVHLNSNRLMNIK